MGLRGVRVCAGFVFSLTQATVSPLRGGGAQAPDSSSLSGRRERGHGNRPCGDSLILHTIRIRRQGGEEPPGPVRTAPAERRALARQREREPNSPQIQTSPTQTPRNLTQNRPRLSCLPDPAGSCPADRAIDAPDLTAGPPRFPATAETLLPPLPPMPLLPPPPPQRHGRWRRGAAGSCNIDGSESRSAPVVSAPAVASLIRLVQGEC